VIKLLFLITFIFAQEKYVCVFEATGDVPKIKFRGSSREEAMERVVRLCMGLRIREYMTLRLKKPSEERMIVFMEDCVNRTYCTEK
jgi:hypothetical protein